MELAKAPRADVDALEPKDETGRERVRDPVAVAELRPFGVFEGDGFIEARAEPSARTFVEPSECAREDHVLVDLRLQFHLELGRFAVPSRALREVDEVADALDDLAERGEVVVARDVELAPRESRKA